MVAQWRFPIDQNSSSKTVGELKSDNKQARKLLSNSLKIIDMSMTDVDRKIKHNKCIDNLIPCVKLLRQKTDFTDDKIIEFQKLFDGFRLRRSGNFECRNGRHARLVKFSLKNIAFN